MQNVCYRWFEPKARIYLDRKRHFESPVSSRGSPGLDLCFKVRKNNRRQVVILLEVNRSPDPSMNTRYQREMFNNLGNRISGQSLLNKPAYLVFLGT